MEQTNNLEKEDYELFKNSLFSFMNRYGIFFFSIIITFMMARFLSQEDWGILIFAQSIIGIMTLIVNLFPPGLNYSLTYYIPVHISSGDSRFLKSIIINSIKQKLIFLIPFYIFCLILINFLSFGFLDPLILYILSPLIIFNSLNLIFNSIFYGYKLFKTLFIITIFQYTFQIINYILLFLIFGKVDIFLIAFILVVQNFLAFLVKFFIFQKKIRGISTTTEIIGEFKEVFKQNLKYGTPIIIAGEAGNLWKELKKQFIGLFLGPSTLTVYNIGETILLIPLDSSFAFQQPLISSFSGFDQENKKNKIADLFKLTFKYALILTSMMTGFFVLFAEFYILIIYGQNYVQYKFFIQLMLLTTVPRVLGAFVVSLLQSINKTKILPFFGILYTGIYICSFFWGIFSYGLIGYAYFLLIALFITFLIQFKFSHTFGGIKLPIKKTLLIFVSFYDSLIISILFIEIIIPNLFLLNSIIGGIIFFILFFIQIFLFKILSEEDLKFLESFFSKDTISNKIFRKIITFLNILIIKKNKNKKK